MLEAAFLGFSNNSKNSDTTRRNDNNNRKLINHNYTQVEVVISWSLKPLLQRRALC